jgi:hypothetical protein
MNYAHKPRASRHVEPACALVGAAIAWWVWGAAAFVVLAALFALLLVLSIVCPRAYEPVHRVQGWLTGRILTLVTWAILSIVFALVFIPAGLALRLARRRKIAVSRAMGEGGTYWTNVEGQVPADFFTRQF